MEGIKSHARRDRLLEIEKRVQKKWEDGKVFEVEAPATAAAAAAAEEGEKFFGNFPYPYMNGLLHLGHAFSLSKLEFAAAYHRLRGKQVLFPFAFHCTGMPIKACADKLAREVAQFGNPPVFPSADEEEEEENGNKNKNKTTVGLPPVAAESPAAPERAEPEKFKSKKSKTTAKAGTAKYQWEIMQALELEDKEIQKFQDPYYWLEYFPPLAKEHLKAFGAGVDWRRSFITTDMNPFYDSFVRWHLQTLKNQGKIIKAMRNTIYSPFDGQPCADHDRASGEGVQPQEYTLIKMEVIAPFTGKLRALSGKRVFLAAATLRPETMYGQTNAWVLPDGQYGAFEINEMDVFVVTKRAALNLAYQHMSRVPEKPTCLLELTGHDLIGLPLHSPLTKHSVIYALPMLTILTDKGTGIVTSVPSDSPDDYMALKDLKSKPALRQKFRVQDEWVLPFEVIPIINIPEFGDVAAEKVCIDLKIQSQNDKEKLAEAKRLTYLKGFTEGTMLVGAHAGSKVSDAKPLIRKLLEETNQAVSYSEPEKKVMSRSGDECVVALTDQWYLLYGEKEWKALAEECLTSMELFNDEARHGFEHTLGWLNQWACSRSFGLGTRVPWDPQFLIESLSDSTIYMAFYTVAHILQGGDLYGRTNSQIRPEEMTHEVWEYIFQQGPMPKTTISPDLLYQMRKEFEYWYPFDLRVSGKDLIQNHLTFCIYNHTAMFPKQKWPRAFRCNGHLMLNSEKMSKSTGNFLTVLSSIQRFSADATRFALADAGDGMDDANFVFETANSAILRLTKELTWMEEVLAAESSLRTGAATSFADRVFDNEMNVAIKVTEDNYNSMLFREALKTGFYDLQTARDEYRLACGSAGMHKDLIWRFMDVQTRLLTPICPHYAEHVWSEIFKQEGFAVKAGWPLAEAPDFILQRANKYLQDVIVTVRKTLQKQAASKKVKQGAKGSTGVPVPSKPPSIALIFVAEKYGGWQEECMKILQNHYRSTRTFSPDAEIMADLKSSSVGRQADFKQIQKQCMPFIKFKKDETLSVGEHALDLTLPFGEIEVLRENIDFITRQLLLETVSVHSFTDADALARAGSYQTQLRQSPPTPGNPVAAFLSASEFPEGLSGLKL
jgi:leucyl-tRNA synthetase